MFSQSCISSILYFIQSIYKHFRIKYIYDWAHFCRCIRLCKCCKHISTCIFCFCFPVTADTFLVEGNRQEHQLSNLKPSTTYSVALYATKGPLTSGTVITNLQTRTCPFSSADVSTVGGTLTHWLAEWPHSRRVPSRGRGAQFHSHQKKKKKDRGWSVFSLLSLTKGVGFTVHLKQLV